MTLHRSHVHQNVHWIVYFIVFDTAIFWIMHTFWLQTVRLRNPLGGKTSVGRNDVLFSGLANEPAALRAETLNYKKAQNGCYG